VTRSHPAVRVEAAVVIAAAVAQLFVWFSGGADSRINKAIRDVQPAASLATRSPSTQSPASAPPSTIPDIEALIPLSVETLRTTVAESVGFVLTQHGTGTGVVISDDLMVTNAHVVWPDPSVSIVFPNGAIHQGRVISLDPFADLALVDISRLSRKPPPIVLGSIDDVAVGDDLYVLGYPSADEFTPIPTVDVGELQSFSDWESTGATWFTIGAPAIGGQSGGAVVDRYGRLVGVSTYGSTAFLTSIAVDDVLAIADRLVATPVVRGLQPRQLPHGGARRRNAVSLEGPWDQELLFGWYLPDTDVSIDWEVGAGALHADTISGHAIAGGEDGIDFIAGYAFPVVISAGAESATDGILTSSVPLITYQDPDHGKVLPTSGRTAGIYEVGGDRDFFYIDLDAGQSMSIAVDSAARTHLSVYAPDGKLVDDDSDIIGFFDGIAEVRFTTSSSGRFIVALESSLSTISGYTVVTRAL
jgi:S1-C subfamily serine protease